MNRDSARGASLGMGLPGDAVNIVYWAEVACGASAGQPYDQA
jgi:hypothetical protein